MLTHWQPLVTNFAVVALVVSVWLHSQFLFADRPAIWRKVGFGFAMGLGAVASMALGFELEPGIRFDLRATIMGIAGFFGGPLAAIISASVAAAYRWSLGDAGATMGIVGIGVAAGIGTLLSLLARKSWSGWMVLVVLSLAIPTANFMARILVAPPSISAVVNVGLPAALMTMLSTAIAAFFITQHRAVEQENNLFRAAFQQSPDLQFVKTPDSRMAAVNKGLAQASGFDDPADMVGMSDFDVFLPESAAALVEVDKQILLTGVPVIDAEETVRTATGDELFYLTSKVPLLDPDGKIIGIAGITRDVTARKGLERDLLESRNKLSYVLAEMSDGIAMFDSQGTLSYCNARYADMFPLTAEARRPGQNLRDILREVIATGEQRGPQPGHEDEWIDEIIATLGTSSQEEVELFNGQWLLIKTRPTSDGSTLVVVSDVTKLKEADAVLSKMTDQLKLLATTDGLTGLTNRRAFDQALEAEVMRAGRASQPVSLMMIDVDRFKAYNDRYGHQGGDAALKTVGFCLKKSLKRPGDVAARYGGEEFAAILPNVDEDNAFFVADAFREALAALKMPHEGSERRYLTASVGLATYDPQAGHLTAGELIRRADEALYNAKAAGRDRVMGWRKRFDVPAEQAKSRA